MGAILCGWSIQINTSGIEKNGSGGSTNLCTWGMKREIRFCFSHRSIFQSTLQDISSVNNPRSIVSHIEYWKIAAAILMMPRKSVCPGDPPVLLDPLLLREMTWRWLTITTLALV
jgi:hypothetical protein